MGDKFMSDKKKSNKISRATFLKKTSKVGAACFLSPLAIKALVSCGSENNPSSSQTTQQPYISRDIGLCLLHGAKFNDKGLGTSGPAQGMSLTTYKTKIENNQATITVNNNKILVDCNESKFAALKTVDNIMTIEEEEAADLPPGGLILYRKSQAELVALSRICPHSGGLINNI